MTRDRLAALRAAQQASNDDEEVVITVSQQQVNDPMQQFFSEVEEIRENVDKMQYNVEEVKKLHSSILSQPQTDEKTKMMLEDMMADIQRTGKRVRNKLKEMEDDLKQLESTKNLSAEYRIKKTQHAMLSQKIVAVMHEYNKMQNDYRERCKARIQRQLEITDKQISNDELEEMLETGNPAIFTQGILTDTQQARQTLADIEARHADIMKLEKSLRELHDMFMDMALLVENQGEMLDRIETHVQTSRDFVETGTRETAKALLYRSKARTKKFICLVIVITILIILVVTLVLSFK